MKALELTRFSQDMGGSMEPEEYGQWVRADEAETELRRLAEVNAELLGALEECAGRLEIHMKHSEDLIAHMRAHKSIAKAKEQQ